MHSHINIHINIHVHTQSHTQKHGNWSRNLISMSIISVNGYKGLKVFFHFRGGGHFHFSGVTSHQLRHIQHLENKMWSENWILTRHKINLDLFTLLKTLVFGCLPLGCFVDPEYYLEGYLRDFNLVLIFPSFWVDRGKADFFLEIGPSIEQECCSRNPGNGLHAVLSFDPTAPSMYIL